MVLDGVNGSIVRGPDVFAGVRCAPTGSLGVQLNGDDDSRGCCSGGGQGE